MKRYQFLLSFSFFSSLASQGVLDQQFIAQFITHEAPWHDSHGATLTDIGGGLLYYTLTYIHKAKLCVCLGSGGGFVPRLMRQAQRDLQLPHARTVVVDGDLGSWGRPTWLAPGSFFRTNFPEIKLVLSTTQQAARKYAKKWRIDYLHIDADHSEAGVLQDFTDYLPLMAPRGMITFHDTAPNQLPCAKIVTILRERGYQIVNFAHLGVGVALLYLG